MSEQRNMLLAVVLSLAILFGWQYFFAPEPIDTGAGETEIAGPPRPGPDLTPSPDDALVPSPGVSTTPQVDAPQLATVERAQAIREGGRIRIEGDRVSGSISLRGGLIDDLILTDYQEELDPDSPQIVVLSPRNAPDPYYVQFGWVGDAGITFPDTDTIWESSSSRLALGAPVTLSWTNEQGVTFRLIYEIDENFMMSITQQIQNRTSAPVEVWPWGVISRTGTPEVTGFFILHEGMLGVFDGTLEEIDYDDGDLLDEGQITYTSAGGWLGITDKYWLVALIPDQTQNLQNRFVHTTSGGQDIYRADFRADATVVDPQGTASVTQHAFIGAKEVDILGYYDEFYEIDRFDLAIDWGWFYFLTRPLFWVIEQAYDVTGNFGVAILVLTVLIKLLFYPLANKSYVAMSAMRKLQPQMMAIRDNYKDDRAKQQELTMELYRNEGVNPAGGCLPMIIQIPVFFALYKVLFVTIEMRHEPFFGWIQDLAARDPTNMFELFGLIPWDAPDLLHVGIWPLIMGISMWLQMRLNPTPADPIQAKLFLFMPILFTFILAPFPAGLVIYWTCNNILSMAQQWMIMKRADIADAKAAAED